MNIMRNAKRRGVVLLVVLAILAIFGLIAVAFVVLTGQARRSARSVENIGLVTDPPQKILQQAAMQVFHGPTTNPTTGVPNPASVMGAHSLLEDIYGNGYIMGEVSTVSPASGGAQWLTITSTVAAAEIARRGGCVFTITEVPSGNDAQKALKGQSTHIIGVDPSSGAFQIQTFSNGAAPPQGAKFTINGVPFSGTGFGYQNDGTFNSDLALRPNDITDDTKGNANGNRNPLGGANDDYDAADFQNMLLAAQVANPAVTGGIQTLPSMHRPALVNYWKNKTGWTGDADSYRKIMLRPIGKMVDLSGDADHPDFTGSNSNSNGFDPINGPWDVDNDGDGVPDSVWIDLGFPVRSTADGRLFKPLFAVLCVDLDGRINLNAHGSIQQTDTTNWDDLKRYISDTQTTITAPQWASSTPPTARGQGFGPAEISPGPMLGTLYGQFFKQLSYNSIVYKGRYGTTGVPGDTASNPDKLSQILWFEYVQALNGASGTTYWALSVANNAGSYGSPPDPFGVGAVGLDPAGRPIYAGFNYDAAPANYVGFGSGTVNNPYEMSFGSNVIRGLPTAASTTLNNPFSASEMERLLRPYDRDATALPDRLMAITSHTLTDSVLLPSATDKANNKSFTTDSFDLPCPNVLLPKTLLGTGGNALTQARHVTDLLRARGVPTSVWGDLLPADLLVGLKMNINRPFGNGQDDNSNGVIDESEPAESTEKVTLSGGTAVSPSYSETGKYKEKSSGTETTTTPLAARQLEARYLYVLACLTCDLDYLKAKLGDADKTARFLAQWAVNVVDFKDRDSIMTPFDYDPDFVSGDISDGWNPNPGKIAKYRVWGCERPELLISETLAFHRRGTEDTAFEQVDATEPGNEEQDGASVLNKIDPLKDHSFDQSYRPQGSLFVELYNPESPLEPRSGDFHDTANGGVELTKVSANTTGTKSPVWRLVIAIPNDDADEEQLDPDNPDATKQPTIEREVYLVDSSMATIPTTLIKAAGRFYPSTPPTKTVIPPCGYGVIGSADSSTSKRTYIGFENGKSSGDPTTTRHIDLTSDAAANATAFPVHKNTNMASPPNPAEPTTANANYPKVLGIDSSRRLSVSEPIGGYDTMEAAIDPNIPNADGKYPKPYDVPFDGKRTDGGEIFKVNGTTAKYRIIYLQRLANPLKPYKGLDAGGIIPTDGYNPYRTIDQMAVDVTAFNGVCDDLNDPDQKDNALATHFQSRQRGENNQEAGQNNIWKEEPADKTFVAANDAPKLSTDTTINAHHFDDGLNHSLGYLNHAFGAPVVDSATSEKGLPAQPFPWLTWNNRPYVTPLELMLVPVLRSSKLLGNAGPNATDPKYNLYYRILNATTNGAVAPYDPGTLLDSELCLANAKVPYPHLMNFFQSGKSDTNDSPQFHRMLEYLGVPSPFIGTGTWANPTSAVSPYLPPFNRISSYREPGRINLNTIYEENVFKGLMAGYPDMKADWSKFIASRRGDAATGAGVLDAPATDRPTEFGNPFRSFGGWTMTPSVLQPAKEINCTLLREGLTAETPLFQSPIPATPNACNDPNRNPYFRYQGITRLGNLVTTRSNVYAVWITVGYFEVTPAGVTNSTYPDGYKLGRELGIDTGEIERHRAFYIFDRTIPVGFQRGQDLNVEKAILVNRFIE